MLEWPKTSQSGIMLLKLNHWKNVIHKSTAYAPISHGLCNHHIPLIGGWNTIQTTRGFLFLSIYKTEWLTHHCSSPFSIMSISCFFQWFISDTHFFISAITSSLHSSRNLAKRARGKDPDTLKTFCKSKRNYMTLFFLKFFQVFLMTVIDNY